MPGLKDEALVAVGNLRAEEKQELGVSRMLEEHQNILSTSRLRSLKTTARDWLKAR